jgi:methionyl aminopeptidase
LERVAGGSVNDEGPLKQPIPGGVGSPSKKEQVRGGLDVEILRSPREIEEMRKAGLLVWQAHRLASSMMRPGVTTAEIDAAVETFFAHHSAEPLFKGVPGHVPFPAVTCISINEEVVHGIPSSRKLVEGDIVSIDTGCKLNGWCGDAAATYPVGRIRPDVQHLLEVTRNVLELAIKLMGKRSRWSEVAAEMEVYVKRHKLSVVEAFVGHGIGREMHEDPQVPNFVSSQLRRGGDFRLVPGLVIAVEPMVNMGTKRVRTRADHWTQATADGRPSAHFEHTVAITESGPYVLTAGPNGEGW